MTTDEIFAEAIKQHKPITKVAEVCKDVATKTVKEFQGEYRWLSNFATVEIVLGDFKYPSTENAYMSEKNSDTGWKKYCSEETNPSKVKSESRQVDLVEGWNENRLTTMYPILLQKFTQEPYKSKLLATGNMELQEGNKWGDTFWGVDLKTGEGQNNLGKLIMRIRAEIS